MLLSMILLHFPGSVVTSHKYLLGQKPRSGFQQVIQLYLSHISIQMSCHPLYICSFRFLVPSLFFPLLALFNAKILVGILVRLVKKSTSEPWMSLSGWGCESLDHISLLAPPGANCTGVGRWWVQRHSRCAQKAALGNECSSESVSENISS